MSCCTGGSLIITALVFAGIAYYSYTPLISDVDDQLQVRYLVWLSKVLHDLGAVGELLGFGPAFLVTRNIGHWTLSNKLPPQIHGLKTEDYTFDGTPVRLYRPVSANSPSPAVIYIHGGGWATLSVDIFDETVGELAVKTGYVFISIDYRLTPEHPFPVAFEDSYKASLYLLKHAEEYGVDVLRIGIAGFSLDKYLINEQKGHVTVARWDKTVGDSAGGNLAAAVSQKISEQKSVPNLRFQWLIYPALQAINFRLPSFVTNDQVTPHFLATKEVVRYWIYYMGLDPTPATIQKFKNDEQVSNKLKQSQFSKYVDYKQLPSKYHSVVENLTKSDTSDDELSKKIEKILVDPSFAPLMKADLSKVPPAFVLTGEYDVVRDDGLLYAERMRKAGVEVETHNAPHSVHGFMFWSPLMPKYSNVDAVIDMFIKFSKKHI